MSEARASQPTQEVESGSGPFSDLDLSELNDRPRASPKEGSLNINTTDSGPDDLSELALLLGMGLDDSEIDPNENPFRTFDTEEFVTAHEQKSEKLSDIEASVARNTEKITTISENIEQVDSVESRLNQIEQELDDLVEKSEAQELVTEETSKQVNERIVAPLLFGAAFLLLIAMFGSVQTGSWITFLIVSPLPILTGYYLWRSREI